MQKQNGKGVESTNGNGEGDKEMIDSTTAQEETPTQVPEETINSAPADKNTKAPIINENHKEDYREIQSGHSDEEGLINSSTELLKQASQLIDDIQQS